MPVGNSATPGYFGRALVVDVTSGAAERIELDDSTLRRFLGGVGLGARLLASFGGATADPLSADAPLIYAFSPLVGTSLTTSAKLAVISRSPLSQRINDALSSSHFAIAGKRSGMDALVIVGAARELSCIVIDNGAVTILPCTDLAGFSPARTAEALRARLGAGFRVSAIGIAGENLVRYATVSNDGRHAGRGGLGAVLGAKRIKAIAVRGSQRVAVADPDRVVKIAADLSARSFGPATAKYRELGTVANLLVFNRLSVLPTRNFKSGEFAGAALLAAENLAPTRERARESCAACTIGCEHVYGYSMRNASGNNDESQSTRIEYESMFALGSLIGVSNPDHVLASAALCDELGIDTISAGGTLAFAMEAVECGLLAPGAAEPPLAFGDGESVHRWLTAIAHRRGVGDLLAEGSRIAAATIGGGSERFACHVKGLELPGYEPRGLHAMALGLAVGARGADHNRSGAYEADFSGTVDRMRGGREHALAAARSEERAALIDSMILCKFLRGVFTDLHDEAAAMLAAVTGWDLDSSEIQITTERIVNARKLFNQAAGWTRDEDTLPPRIFEDSASEGTAAAPERATLSRDRLDSMIQAYYVERGWDAEGRVPAAVIRRLALLDLFADLHRPAFR